jgi:inositol transport system substrate-binding protein
MKKSLSLSVVILVLIVSMLAGCGSNNNAPANNAPANNTNEGSAPVNEPANEPAEEIVVGITLQDVSNEFIAMLKEAMEIKAKDYPNLKIIINDAEARPDKQTSQMDTFIAQNVDAIIINPADANALVPAIENAIAADIPVITLSSDVSEDVGQKWSGSKNEDAGRLQMEYIAKKLNGKGNVAVLRGPIGHFAEIGRFAGYQTVLDENPEMEVVFDQTGNWSREQGMTIVENWIQSGKQIDAIVAQNDEMALGALKAVEDSGKKDEIIVSGIDAIKDALDSVKDGGLDSTFFQDSIGQAFGAIDMAVKAANGEEIEPNIIPFEEVTIENADSYYDRIELKK